MIWQTKTRTFDLKRRALMMGIVNLTPNSFSDGGQFVEVEAEAALQMKIQSRFHLALQ